MGEAKGLIISLHTSIMHLPPLIALMQLLLIYIGVSEIK